MKIILPKRRNGADSSEIQLAKGQCMLIVGANGAGKTRFTAATARSLGEKAYPISALDGLFERHDDITSPTGVIKSYITPSISAGCPQLPTQLELLLARLMNDEMLNLIGYKLSLADGKTAELRPTFLDKVVELWQDIFPGNRVLIDSGKILFSRGIGSKGRPALRLSHGERAVLYHAASVLYAPHNAVIFVDSPESFLHPSITASLWNRLENLRSDCTFCYTTHDTEFATSRNGAPVVWVRDCDPSEDAWDYDILPPDSTFSPELYMTLAGARKPMLFIEGDSERSIDAKLYPLIFPDYTVRSLGSCNKVIEATRTFNDLSGFHKIDSRGIVDRDRRNDAEVAYLRRKKIMVPEVAEVENILILPRVVAAMARVAGADPGRVTSKVRHAVMSMFKADLKSQALLHTRHRVKRTMEYRADSRSSDITSFEKHLDTLLAEIRPREIYEQFCREFRRYVQNDDYEAVLRVYNQKSMLPGCNVAQLCGFGNKEGYIEGIMEVLRHNGPIADEIRNAVLLCLCGEVGDNGSVADER